MKSLSDQSGEVASDTGAGEVGADNWGVGQNLWSINSVQQMSFLFPVS